MLLKDLFFSVRDALKKENILDYNQSAEEIIANVLHYTKSDLYLHFEKSIDDEKIFAIEQGIQRRIKKEPLSHIISPIPFYDVWIEVNKDVLTPRPETELLVEKICNHLKKSDRKGKILWDICTGSGCIGIAVKKRFPELSVFLSDLSSEALEVAKKNALRNQVEVTCLQGDLLTPFLGKKADIIVANPPYLSEKEYHEVSDEMRKFEPRQALIGGSSGLKFYQRFAKELWPFLHPGAKLFFEIGQGQGKAVQEIFLENKWPLGEVFRDFAQKERFFFLEIG